MKNDTAIFDAIAKRIDARSFGVVSIPQLPKHVASSPHTDEALKQPFPRIVIAAQFQLGRGPIVAERALLLIADKPKQRDLLQRYLSTACERGSRSVLFKDGRGDAICLLRPRGKNHSPLEKRIGSWDAKLLPRYHALMLFHDGASSYRCAKYDIVAS